MAAAPDHYVTNSGGRVSAGRFRLPAWVSTLEAGKFANISNNTFLSVRPADWYGGSDVSGPFKNWSGAIFAPHLGKHGSWVIHGSGHLSTGTVLWAGVWGFDLETQLWSGRNVPAAPILEGGAISIYAESQETATLGHTYTPHTYDGLVYQPPEHGGGVNGSLLRNCIAGSGLAGARCVHKFDLSSTTEPPVRVIDSLPVITTSYPQTAADNERGGYWALSANGAGGLGFISFDDWAVTTYPSISFSAYGDYSLTYIPAPYDCLFSIGRYGTGGVDQGAFVCPIVGGVPQGFTKISLTGTLPEDKRCGACWSVLLDCLVTYSGGGSYNVTKISPPAVGSLTTGNWVCSTETFTGMAGATPSFSGGQNGSWSRFIEIPNLRCFVWCDGVSQPVQAWRLEGM